VESLCVEFFRHSKKSLLIHCAYCLLSKADFYDQSAVCVVLIKNYCLLVILVLTYYIIWVHVEDLLISLTRVTESSSSQTVPIHFQMLLVVHVVLKTTTWWLIWKKIYLMWNLIIKLSMLTAIASFRCICFGENASFVPLSHLRSRKSQCMYITYRTGSGML